MSRTGVVTFLLSMSVGPIHIISVSPSYCLVVSDGSWFTYRMADDGLCLWMVQCDVTCDTHEFGGVGVIKGMRHGTSGL